MIKKIKLILSIALLVFCNNLCAQKEGDIIMWTPNYKLKWEDFQGNRTSAYFNAETNTSITFIYNWEDSGVMFKSSCYFDKKRSWVYSSLVDSQMLQHEQLHFDIAELNRRIFVSKLLGLDRRKTYYSNDIDKMYNDILVRESLMNKQYDFETLHGTNKEKQREWNVQIMTLLSQNPAYKKDNMAKNLIMKFRY